MIGPGRTVNPPRAFTCTGGRVPARLGARTASLLSIRAPRPMATLTLMDKLVSLSKRRGFVFQSSEVYGGLGSVWDYGPLGVELKNNVKRAWWRAVVYERDDMVGLDSGLLMNRLVWKYSGHEETFSDPLVDCRKCKTRLRADKIEDGKCP